MIQAMVFAAALADPTSLFALEHAAVGGSWDRVNEVVERGNISSAGLSGPYTSYTDPHTGYTKTTATLSGLVQGSGFDSTGAWSLQGTLVEPLNDAGGIASALSAAYIARNGWWNPSSDPATFTAVDERTVRIVPKGGDPLVVTLDATTHLIAKIADTSASAVTTTTTYSDYRSVAGVMYPFVTRVSIGDPKYDQITHVTSVDFPATLTAADIARPANQRTGSIAHGPATTLPFAFENPRNAHIVVAVHVNGSRTLHMVFDTGGSNVVTPEVAKEIGLKGSGSVPVGGAGEQQQAVQLASGATLKIADATLRDQQFAIIPLPASLATRQGPIDGIIGYEVAKNFVVSIDYAHQQMTLIDPKAFDAKNRGAAIRFASATIPVIPAVFDGVPGSFMFDTGNAFYNTISQDFVAAHHLKLPGSTLVQSSGNLGGAIRSRLVRPPSIKIGPYTIARPVFAVTTTKQGSLAGTAFAGNIAETIISRFTITLDYDHSIIYMKPNVLFPLSFVGSLDGMSLYRPTAHQLTVSYVNSGSPAAVAGMRAGDAITAVNGTPVRTVSVGDIQKYEATHRSITVTYARNEVKHTVTLHMHELVP